MKTPQITHVSGHLPTGKQAEMDSRLNFDYGEVLKSKTVVTSYGHERS